MIVLSALLLTLVSPARAGLPNQTGGVCWDSGGAGCGGNTPKFHKSPAGGGYGGGGGGMVAPAMAPSAASTFGGMLGGAIGTMLFTTPQPAPGGTPFFGIPNSPGPAKEAEPPVEETKPAPPPKEEKKPKLTVMGVELSASPSSLGADRTVTLTAHVDVHDDANTGEMFSKAGFKVVFRVMPAAALKFGSRSAVTDADGNASVRAAAVDEFPHRAMAEASIEGFTDQKPLFDPSAPDRPAGLPRPASDAQVDATIAQLSAYLTYDRTQTDAADPVWDYSACPSKCGCPDKPKKVGEDAKGRPIMGVTSASCTDDCFGTCYQWGGKSLSPEGTGKSYGVDCSGLIRQEDLDFWKQADRYTDKKAICPVDAPNCSADEKKPCADLGGKNDCHAMTQQQLEMLIVQKRDNIDDPGDLRAGDVAYFEKGDAVDHVVHVVSDPVCDEKGCSMTIIESPHSGVAVRQRELKLDPGGCLIGAPSTCFFRGGTPRQAPQTGDIQP